MAEQLATVGDLKLCYQTFGDYADEPMLLIAGLGSQMLSWDEKFCSQLASEGFYVIRYDNRDVGHSSRIDSDFDLQEALDGDVSRLPYTLEDLADDAAGLLAALGCKQAHAVGISMGGMIAQLLTIRHPHRVWSLTSIMSTTGNPVVGQASEAAREALLAPSTDSSLEALIQADVRRARVWESPAYARSDHQLRASARQKLERAPRGDAGLRQMAAIVAAHDRAAELRRVRVPSLVIHGEEDQLVHISGGRATAKALPEAQLLTFRGMGHDLPFQLWPDFVAAIAANARRHQY